MESRGRRSTTPYAARIRKTILYKICFIVALSICIATLMWGIKSLFFRAQIGVETPEGSVPLSGWQPSSSPRSYWLPPPGDSNGFLVVHCYGGTYHHRREVSDAVLAARILNATLVIPRLGAELQLESIYNVTHFNISLLYDIHIVEEIPIKNRVDPYKVHTPKRVRLGWLIKVALPKLRVHGVISMSHLTVETEEPELQRLRCRVAFHALKFTEDIRRVGDNIMDILQRNGDVVAMHIYRESEGSILSPTEVSILLSAIGFGTSTSMYLTAGEGAGIVEYLMKFNGNFRNATSLSQIHGNKDLHIWFKAAVDYIVCLRSKIFILVDSDYTCDVLGHRMYSGFRRSLHLSRALTEILRKEEEHADSIRQYLFNTSRLLPRVRGESFSENPFPDCFCRVAAKHLEERCPRKHIWVIHNDTEQQTDHDDGHTELRLLG